MTIRHIGREYCLELQQQGSDDHNPQPELWKNHDGTHIPVWYSPMNRSPEPRFLQLKDLISDQGDIALVIETDSMSPDTHKILSFSRLPL